MKFRYKNGYLGEVSEKVAHILESKGEGCIVVDRPTREPKDSEKKENTK